MTKSALSAAAMQSSLQLATRIAPRGFSRKWLVGAFEVTARPTADEGPPFGCGLRFVAPRHDCCGRCVGRATVQLPSRLLPRSWGLPGSRLVLSEQSAWDARVFSNLPSKRPRGIELLFLRFVSGQALVTRSPRENRNDVSSGAQ